METTIYSRYPVDGVITKYKPIPADRQAGRTYKAFCYSNPSRGSLLGSYPTPDEAIQAADSYFERWRIAVNVNEIYGGKS